MAKLIWDLKIEKKIFDFLIDFEFVNFDIRFEFSYLENFIFVNKDIKKCLINSLT